MTRGRTRAHRAVLVAALGIALTACSPQTDPVATPSPTGFASEAEAFAAAEATYRAYIDALNEGRETGDMAPASTFLTSQAKADEDQTQEMLAEQGLRIVGTTSLLATDALWASDNEVAIGACIDVSQTAVLDPDDVDVTPSERPTQVELEVRMQGSPERLLITTSEILAAQC